MSQKSKWVETSYIIRGVEVVLPLRCCVEVRKNRIRTWIQKHVDTDPPAPRLFGTLQSPCKDGWLTVFRSGWVESPNAHRAPHHKLDEAAGVIADTIEDVVGEEFLRSLAETMQQQEEEG